MAIYIQYDGIKGEVSAEGQAAMGDGSVRPVRGNVDSYVFVATDADEVDGNDFLGWNSNRFDRAEAPDLGLTRADDVETGAIAFVGGWGSSMYQYAFEG